MSELCRFVVKINETEVMIEDGRNILEKLKCGKFSRNVFSYLKSVASYYPLVILYLSYFSDIKYLSNYIEATCNAGELSTYGIEPGDALAISSEVKEVERHVDNNLLAYPPERSELLTANMTDYKEAEKVSRKEIQNGRSFSKYFYVNKKNINIVT